MPLSISIRAATTGDLPAISELIGQLGYTVRREVFSVMLDSMLADPRHVILVAEQPDHGTVAMLALSSRPVLRLQGWIGVIEELVVRRGLRDRGVGDRLIQYAKGLAAERGWIRLETVVARRRESNRRSFLFSRGFVAAESIIYRWGLLEGQHQVPPLLYSETNPPEVA